jgi:hypothetical protein
MPTGEVRLGAPVVPLASEAFAVRAASGATAAQAARCVRAPGKAGSLAARESGWSDSNRRSSRSQTGRSTRLSYTPRPVQSTHCVAGRAHELAVLDLGDQAAERAAVEKITDLVRLGSSGKVIPVHGHVRERSATVGARSRLLQRLVPRVQLLNSPPAGREPMSASPLPVLGVVRAPAFLAPRLVNRSPSVEVVCRLGFTALTAMLLHLVNIGN